MLLQGLCASTGMHLRPGTETASSPSEGAARREAAIASCPPPAGLPGLPSTNRLVLHFVNKRCEDLPGGKCCSGHQEKGETPTPPRPPNKGSAFFFFFNYGVVLFGKTAASRTPLTILCPSVSGSSGRLCHVPGQVAQQDLHMHLGCANTLGYTEVPHTAAGTSDPPSPAAPFGCPGSHACRHGAPQLCAQGPSVASGIRRWSHQEGWLCRSAVGTSTQDLGLRRTPTLV